MKEKCPNRFGSPDDLLGTALWLADEDMSGISQELTSLWMEDYMSYSGG